jgi:hypothetical protein
VQSVDRGTIKAAVSLAATDIDDKRRVSLTNLQVGQLRQLLAAVTEYHVGRRAQLKSLDFLRKLNLMSFDGGKRGKDSN